MQVFGWPRALALIGLLLLGSSCASRSSPPLSINEHIAHVLLLDQLDKLDIDRAESVIPLCTYVLFGEEEQPVSPALLDILRQAASKDPRIEIVDGSTCAKDQWSRSVTKDGKQALNFFAARIQDPIFKEANWRAGWIGWHFAGEGDLYKIEIENSKVTAESISQWVI